MKMEKKKAKECTGMENRKENGLTTIKREELKK
jgi:hypothetical protein